MGEAKRRRQFGDKPSLAGDIQIIIAYAGVPRLMFDAQRAKFAMVIGHLRSVGLTMENSQDVFCDEMVLIRSELAHLATDTPARGYTPGQLLTRTTLLIGALFESERRSAADCASLWLNFHETDGQKPDELAFDFKVSADRVPWEELRALLGKRRLLLSQMGGTTSEEVPPPSRLN